MMASINEFAVQSVALDSLFERVKCDLEMIEDTITSEVGLNEENGKRTNFTNTAEALQKRYVDLQWETRTLATKVEAYLLDFVDVVLSSVVDYATSDATKHAELNAFINRLRPDFASPEGEEPVQAFSKIEQDTRAFLQDAITFSGDYSQRLRARNKELRELKDGLEKQSKEYQEVLTGTPIRIGLTLGATAFGTVLALSTPFASATIATAGLGYAVFESAKTVTNIKRILDINHRRNALINLNELSKAVDRVDGVHARLTAEPARIPSLSQLSQCLSCLWDMVNREAQQADGCDLTNLLHNENLLLRIGNLSVTYKTYASTLRNFTTTLNQAGIFVARG